MNASWTSTCRLWGAWSLWNGCSQGEVRWTVRWALPTRVSCPVRRRTWVGPRRSVHRSCRCDGHRRRSERPPGECDYGNLRRWAWLLVAHRLHFVECHGVSCGPLCSSSSRGRLPTGPAASTAHQLRGVLPGEAGLENESEFHPRFANADRSPPTVGTAIDRRTQLLADTP